MIISNTTTTLSTDHHLINSTPSYKAYKILYYSFTMLPLVTGIDKFFDALVKWPIYLAPWIGNVVTNFMSIETFMKIGGITEIVTAIFVAIKPKWGAFLLAFWLLCITFNLLSIPGYYDIALRDFILVLCALALGFLAKDFSK